MDRKLAIIGFGGMGNGHYNIVTERIPALSVKGVYDIREEALAKAREKGLHTYGSLEALLGDAEIDIVTVATPNNFHKPLSIACLNAGKHVICEKPVTLNAAELEEIIAASKRAGKLFAVHQNRRWDRDFLTVKKIIESGEIGKPYYIESRVLGGRYSAGGWRGYRENGGGMVLDWGVHLLDQILTLVDSPVISVNAHMYNLSSPEVEDNFKVTLLFENGLSVLVEMITNCFIPQPRWHVSCTGGGIVIEDWSCKGELVKWEAEPNAESVDTIVYKEGGPVHISALKPAYTALRSPLPAVESDGAAYYNNFLAAIDGRAELIVKPEQSLRVMKVVDASFESSEGKRAIQTII